MNLHVGQPGIQGDITRYADRFDLLEVRAEPGHLPRTKRLRQWKSQVPARFTFSVVLPRLVASLESERPSESALEPALRAADALGARWLVLQTPPSATPSSRTRRRLAALVEGLLRSDRQIGWEPRGLWEDEAAESAARELGIALVRDVSRSPAPAGEVVYARLRALGDGGRVRSSAIERAAVELALCSEAFVVIEGRGAPRAAALLRELADRPRDPESKGGAIAAGLLRATSLATHSGENGDEYAEEEDEDQGQLAPLDDEDEPPEDDADVDFDEDEDDE